MTSTRSGHALRVAVVGDRWGDNESQEAIEPALEHSAAALGVECEVTWFDTPSLERSGGAPLAGSDLVWAAPGSPFKSLDGALAGITWARERSVPLLGTCAGFQHGVLEFARNMLAMDGAAHREYDAAATDPIIDRLQCSLPSEAMGVRITDEVTAAWYGHERVEEDYYCTFGLNPAYRPTLVSGGMVVAGVDAADGDVRILRLVGHHFFVLTLFVPQTRSAPGEPHPLVTAFVSSAAQA